ncbi:pitrilysin family protein [Anaerofustis sp. NSJ-163]|uniref:M16 family metallopeptidase n=1 Tax=Anaerofustis sp. NSJ-163 TaxID=2944391 RepID=UPI00209C3ECD|nr:insulinase family protein [Anaerofustis sp. NSJ-163]MCO8193721.1 insulinase family protein [Anaerofustis sp. NSJ-163]
MKAVNIVTHKNNNLSNICVGFCFYGGVIYENNKVRGISHLLEHLFFRRLNNFSQRELYKNLNKIGVSLKGVTYKDHIKFSATVLPKYFNNFVDIVINLYEDFNWSDREIFSEKEVVKRQIEESGESYFRDIVNRNYYKGSCIKNSIMGETYHIDNLSSKIIHDYKKRIFNKENSLIILTGNFNQDNIHYLGKKLNEIEGFKHKELVRQKAIPDNFCNRNKNNHIIIPSEYDINDIEIIIDIDNSVDINMVEMLFNIFAIGDGSRLTFKLKDTLGYVGDMDCEYDFYKEFKTVTLSCSVNNNVLVETINIIFEEMNKMKKNLTNNDIDEVIVFCKDFSYIIDSSQDYNDLISNEYFLLNNKDFSIKDKVDKLNNITADDLMKTAKILFKPENISIYVENNSRIERKYKVVDCIENNLCNLSL